MTIEVKPIDETANEPNCIAVFVQRLAALWHTLIEAHERAGEAKENRRSSPAKNSERRW